MLEVDDDKDDCEMEDVATVSDSLVVEGVVVGIDDVDVDCESAVVATVGGALDLVGGALDVCVDDNAFVVVVPNALVEFVNEFRDVNTSVAVVDAESVALAVVAAVVVNVGRFRSRSSCAAVASIGTAFSISDPPPVGFQSNKPDK